MCAMLPDGCKVLVRRVEWVGRTTKVVAHVLRDGGHFEWKSISGPCVADTVEDLLRKYPQFEGLEWKRLFDDDRYG